MALLCKPASRTGNMKVKIGSTVVNATRKETKVKTFWSVYGSVFDKLNRMKYAERVEIHTLAIVYDFVRYVV